MTRAFRIGAAIAALAGCAGGGETGNPVVPTRIDLQVRSTDPELIALSDGVEGASVLDQAWVALGTVEFLGDEQCAMWGELDGLPESQVIADVAQPGAHVTIDVAPGRYCGLLVSLPTDTASSQLPDGAPIELTSNSMVLRGTRADGTPFLITHPEQDELELALPGGLDVERDGRNLLLSFDVATWIEGLDLDGAEVGDDGVIRIDDDDNAALWLTFEDNLECSLELYFDEDGDRRVDAGELQLGACAPQ